MCVQAVTRLGPRPGAGRSVLNRGGARWSWGYPGFSAATSACRWPEVMMAQPADDFPVRPALADHTFSVDQSRYCRVAAQLIQAAAAAWPNAPDWDAQRGADLGVWDGGVFGQQGE